MTFLGPYQDYEMISGWLIFAIICARGCERRHHFLLRMVLPLSICLPVSTLYTTSDFVDLYYYLLLVVFFGGLWFCIQCSIWQTMFIMGVVYAFQYIMYSSWIFLSTLLIPNFRFLDTNIWIYLIYYTSLVLVSFAAWHVTRSFKHIVELKEFSPSVTIIFTAVVLVTGFLSNRINKFDSWDAIATARILSALVCALAIWISADILVSRKIEINNAMQRYIIERQKAEYELRKETINDLNIKCHDLKYQIRAIYSRIGKHGTEDLKEIEECIVAFQSSYKTGNETLDIVLSEKARTCEEKGISFNFTGRGELIAFMSDMDIYRLFSNAIDNSIEALDKVEKDKRIIGVIIEPTGPFISVYFENYYNGELDFADNIPLTSKENKLSHGFGLRSIKAIAESYEAQLSIGHDNEVFSLTILFPSTKNQ